MKLNVSSKAKEKRLVLRRSCKAVSMGNEQITEIKRVKED